MTNAELIAKIKAEINRMKVNYLNRSYTFVPTAMQQLLDFIDTLGSEKPMNPGDAMKELDEKIALVKQRGTWDGVDVDKYMDEVRGREPEKPEADLEQEVISYFQGLWPGTDTPEECNTHMHFTPPAIMRLARHFAKWQKDQMMKEAVEGVLVDNVDGTQEICLHDNRYGDKVRIIIVKEDEK